MDFRAGRYDLATLETLYSGGHVRARAVLQAVERAIPAARLMRALAAIGRRRTRRCVRG